MPRQAPWSSGRVRRHRWESVLHSPVHLRCLPLELNLPFAGGRDMALAMARGLPLELKPSFARGLCHLL